MTIKKVAAAVEQVSHSYAKKFGFTRDTNWFVLKLQEELGELIQNHLMLTKQARSKGKTEQELKDAFADEVADVFCHVLLLAKHTHVDLEKAVERKWLSWNKKA